MATLPVRFASVAIFGCLAVSAFDIVTGLEHWPFGSYPMYSTVYSDRLSWLRLYGVTDRGEIPLRGEFDFGPFDEARLTMALQRLQSARGGDRKIGEALRNLMRLYNRRESGRSPAGTPLRALRLYNVYWALRPGLQGVEPPSERTPVAEVTEDAAEGGR